MRILRSLRTTRSGSERSAVVVITALMAVVLLGFAAIAIDLTNARQVRRQAQGSADSAALAAAQDLPDPNVVVATVKDYALQNFGTATGDWVGCTDPDALKELPDLANSNTCISIDEPFARVRVRLPVAEVDTVFGGVLGYDQLDVSASAVAEADLTKDDRIIPATVAAAAGSGNLCIENGGNDVDCASRSSGNFGSFDSDRIRIYLPTSSKQANALRINYSMGVDHPLAIYSTSTSAAKVCDVDLKSPCSTTNVDSPDEEANHLIPYTGNNVPPLTDGVIEDQEIATDSGTWLFCGRLRRPDLNATNLTLTDPDNCEYWDGAPSEAGPAITKLGKKLNGRHVSYWMLDCDKEDTSGSCGASGDDIAPHDPNYDDRFRTLFYGDLDPVDNSTEPSSSDYWDAGDAKLECFMKSYRFDYKTQQEYFIDPTKPVNSLGQGTAFADVAQATDYLLNTCNLDENLGAEFIEGKMTSLSDKDDFWPMFENGAVGDARFGMIPVVGNWANGNSDGMPIVRFWATYMYRLYAGSSNLKAIDAWVFEPALIDTRSGVANLQFGYQSDQPWCISRSDSATRAPPIDRCESPGDEFCHRTDGWRIAA